MTNEVDPAGLGSKILDLLKVGAGCELEISLLRSGQILVSKSQEDGKKNGPPI